MGYLGFACHCLVGLVFGVSALTKLRSRRAFDEFVMATRALLVAADPAGAPSHVGTRWVSVAVVTAESAIPVLIVIPALNRFGLGLAAFLLIGFGTGIAAAMHRGVRTSCRCFGSSSRPLGTRHLVRNASLLLVAVAGLAIRPAGRPDPAGRVVAAVVAIVLAIVVIHLDDLIDPFTSNLSVRRT